MKFSEIETIFGIDCYLCLMEHFDLEGSDYHKVRVDRTGESVWLTHLSSIRVQFQSQFQLNNNHKIITYDSKHKDDPQEIHFEIFTFGCYNRANVIFFGDDICNNFIIKYFLQFFAVANFFDAFPLKISFFSFFWNNVINYDS